MVHPWIHPTPPFRRWIDLNALQTQLTAGVVLAALVTIAFEIRPIQAWPFVVCVDPLRMAGLPNAILHIANDITAEYQGLQQLIQMLWLTGLGMVTLLAVTCTVYIRCTLRPVRRLNAFKDGVSDRVEGLDAGADDYVVKPFSIEELMARVRAHLRHTNPQAAEVLVFLDLTLDRKSHQVKRGSRLIDLTAKEFDLLDDLMTNPRQVLTRDRILREVWAYDFMDDSNIIEVYVGYLRLKLEAGGKNRLIQTVRGVGYVLQE